MCDDPSHLVTECVPETSRGCYPLIVKVKEYLATLKGRVLWQKTARKEWIKCKRIRDTLLDEHFDCTYYGANRDDPCECKRSKRVLLHLDYVEDLQYFTERVNGLEPDVPEVIRLRVVRKAEASQC